MPETPPPPHEPSTCPRCEHPAEDTYRRHWKHEPKGGNWHVIADGPDLVARLPRQAHYVTVLAYRPGDDETSACYRGPLYAEWDGHDPAGVLEELRTCLQALQVEFDLPAEALRLWHSGGRGYHLTLPVVVIGAEAGHPQLPHIYAAMIGRLFPPHMASTLDRGIYNMGKGRMWRLPNRRRMDTGRYKVPLAMLEVLYKPYGELEALTTRPRKGLFWPSEDELSPCPALVQLYQEATVAMEQARGRQVYASRDSAPTPQGILFHAFSGRGWIGEVIEPGKWAVQCPWEASHTKGERFDTSTVIFAPADGDTLGWFHCSHAHCHGRALHDVLAIFTPSELQQAAAAAGLRTSSAMSGRYPSRITVEVA